MTRQESWDWYKHFPSRFLGGVTGLGPDVIGAYIVILDLIYLDGKSCPNDPRYLAGILGCNGRKAAGLVQVLVSKGKLTKIGDRLINETASQVIDERLTSQRRARDTGATGGRRSADVRSAIKENNALAEATLNQLDKNRIEKNRIETISQPKTPVQPSLLADASDTPTPRQMLTDFDQFYRAFPRRVGRGDAERAYSKARKLATPDQLLAGARRYAVSRSGEDPKYTKHPATWLNSKGWLDEVQTASGQPAPPVVGLAQWLERLELFYLGDRKEDIDPGYWSQRWGPEKGQPGCLVPPEADAAFAAKHGPRLAVVGSGAP